MTTPRKFDHALLKTIAISCVFFSGLGFGIQLCQDFGVSCPQYHITYRAPRPEPVEKTIGLASWYDYQLDGTWWSLGHNTAASRDLPRYSYARVTNPENGNSVVVYVNDYGPHIMTGRDIDLSSHAFAELAPLSRGVIHVEIEPYNDK